VSGSLALMLESNALAGDFQRVTERKSPVERTERLSSVLLVALERLLLRRLRATERESRNGKLSTVGPLRSKLEMVEGALDETSARQ
jgi:hypothetical protein